MNIALVGASGFLGKAILEEALSRNHRVTALVRDPSKLNASKTLEVKAVDALDTEALARVFSNHDAVISAFSGHAQADVLEYYLRGIRSIIRATKLAGIPRLLVVGGAGSLEVAPGVQLIDTPNFPAAYRATAEGARQALNILRDEATLNWTLLSPSALIEPGPRTGKFRLGGDQLLVDANGASRITTGDYAAAMIDELESPKHTQHRFTVGY
ncbi:MAG: NAD(P)-dependent oxidoreductase [Povalibacter sp.]